MASLSRLPDELVQQVIDAALPVPTRNRSAWLDRNAILRRFALVSPVWRSFVQEKLLEHVYFDDTTTPLLQSLAENGLGPRFDVGRIRTAVFAGELAGTMALQRKAVELLSGVREIWVTELSGLSGSQHEDESLAFLLALGRLPTLRSLHLREIWLELPPSLAFPHLRHLSVCLFDYEGLDWSTFLQSTNFPRLSALTIVTPQWEENDVAAPLSSIISQLSTLALIDLDGWTNNNMSPCFAHASRLRNLLLLDPGSELLDSLRTQPITSLRSLYLQEPRAQKLFAPAQNEDLDNMTSWEEMMMVFSGGGTLEELGWCKDLEVGLIGEDEFELKTEEDFVWLEDWVPGRRLGVRVQSGEETTA